MNPVVTAAVVVVGAIAAALCYVMHETPPPQTQNRYRQQDRVYRNYNSSSTINVYVSNSGRPNDSETEVRNRKKQRKKVTLKNENCSFCLEPLTGDLEILACDHAYHAKCLEEYFKSDKPGKELRCPLCRTSID